MISSTSQRIAVSTARRLATAQPIRLLSYATMGFDEIAEWKEDRRKDSDPRHRSKDTIFDLKVYTPIHNSSTWNVSYASNEINTAQVPTSLSSPPLSSSKRFRTHSRHFAALAAGQPTLTNTVKPTVESPIRLSAASMFSSLAADTKPTKSVTSSVFGSERRATEIDDVPGPEVLVKLRAEKLPPAEPDLPEPQAMGIAPNGDVVPLTVLKKFNLLRAPSTGKQGPIPTALEPWNWYP